LGHRNVHSIIDCYVRACVCMLCMWAFAPFFYVLAPKFPLRGLHAFYVRTCVCTPHLCVHTALCTCVHCMHMQYTNFRTDPLQTWCNILRVTESCISYLIFTCALACARYTHACTHMRACVRSHIFGCIRSKFGGDIPLHELHDFYMRTCVCTLCVHYARAISMPVLHACARSHIFGRFLSKLSGTFYGAQRVACAT
jgi:hypothetical protein